MQYTCLVFLILYEYATQLANSLLYFFRQALKILFKSVANAESRSPKDGFWPIAVINSCTFLEPDGFCSQTAHPIHCHEYWLGKIDF